MKVRSPLGGMAWAAGLLVAFAAGVRAEDVSQWARVAPVEIKGAAAKGLIEFPITPEVFAAANLSLGDLRLAGPSGEFVPYVVRSDEGESWTDSYEPRLFNATFVPGKESSVTADFGVKALRTRIGVVTPGNNFRRRIRVEASADDSNWQILKANDWLVHVHYEQGDYNKSEVILPDNDFRYLRVTVYNGPDDPERVDIQGVKAWRQQAVAPQTEDVPAQSLNLRQDGKTTDIEVDLGYENLPLSGISLGFEDANFLRRVEISGRNVRSRTITKPVENSQPRTREVEEPWSSMASPTIYRFPGGAGLEPAEMLQLPISGQYRYLLLQIQNADNAPLKFSGMKVQRLKKYVAFRADAPAPLQLYAGNSSASPPNYDLENFATRLRSEGVMPAALGALAANPRFTIKTSVAPWSERHIVLLWSALIAIVVVLSLLVMTQMKQAKAQENSQRSHPTPES